MAIGNFLQSAIELTAVPKRKAAANVDPIRDVAPNSPTTAVLEVHTSNEIAIDVGPSQGGTLTVAEDSELPMTKYQLRRSRLQLGALCWGMFLLGWTDGTTGPLLPKIKSVFDVGFTLVSLIFVFACFGYITGALMNVVLSERLAFGKITAAVLQVVSPNFAVFVLAFVLNGFGSALQDSQANGFVASLKDGGELKMGVLHASYVESLYVYLGFGALVAPLVATQFSHLERWSFHYLISLGLALSNFAGLAMVFRFRTHDECLVEIGQAPGEKSASEHSTFRQILGLRFVHLLAIFILIYVGIEVTIGGWIVTFVIDVRGGGPSSGYISSGFFGGLTVGRIALLWVNRKLGGRRAIALYGLLAIVFELILWLVPSQISTIISVTIIGILLGPIFPLAMNHAGRVLPKWLLTSSIGWIAGFGQAGSALLPFMTGAISSKWGIQSLQPLLVIMMVIMIGVWAIVPSQVRRVD
ncbi:MFS general substrate transporter [Pluteus cervinus]|uniref:MFS general substrate transporter n=1 Tax=Pluteus cervinus TaxID=181527 RepID=A0ACD3B2T2_9AGAR|nr:MFS general substrate transporter [Pluteus cervinus]